MPRTYASLFILTALFTLSALTTNAQSTVFTYQGSLQATGSPATGNYDFEFALFDAVSGGTQLGTTISQNSVTVTNGTFAVSLDFGSQFPGAPRFLEIRVRQSGGGAFTTLSPRQSVSSAPYSIKSLSAETASSAVNATSAVAATNFTGNLSGDVSGSQFSTTVERLQGRSVANTAPTDGQVLKFNTANNRWQPDTDSTSSGSGGGTITGVTAGTGLTGGGTSGNVGLSIANGGVGTLQIADNSVTDAKINGVSGSKVTGSVANSNQLGGVAANQYVVTGDPRLSDARSPTAGSSNYIQNSSAPQASSNFNISGNGTVSGTLSGFNVNATNEYRLGGNRVLSAFGNNNLVVGRSAGQNTTGNQNSFFGIEAGMSNTTGHNNTFSGYLSGNANTGGYFNSLFGSGSGSSNTTGFQNSFFGLSSGTFNTIGDNNAFFGAFSGNSNSLGRTNAFVGASSGYSNTEGGANAFFGYRAGYSNTTGGGNTYSGSNAGDTNTTGSNNTIIGNLADVGSDNLANATAIGANAQVSQSNSLVLGSVINVNGAAASTNVGIGTTTPAHRLHVVGNGLFTGDLTVNGTLNANLSGNFIQNTTTQQPSSNLNISGNGIFAGQVAIGTASPGNSRFVVNHTVPSFAAAQIRTSGLAAGSSFGLQIDAGTNIADFALQVRNQAGTALMQVGGDGNVFVPGTASFGVSSTSGYRLGVDSSVGGGINVTGNGTGINAFSTTLAGRFETPVSANNAIKAIVGSPSGTQAFSAVWGDSSNISGVAGSSNSGVGVLGISTSSTGGAFSSQTNIGISGQGGPYGGVFSASTGRGVYGSGPTHGGDFSSSGRGVNAFGGAYGGFFDTQGNGIGINAHSVNGVAIFARSENTHALYADGSIFVNRWIVVQELPGSGMDHVCRSASNILSMCSSSLRYKQNIDQFRSGLSLISRLRPIKFDWKADGKHDLGLGAEDVEKIEPLLVTYNKDGQVEGVKYDRISVVLVNAVKEQQKQIEAQQKQIAALLASNTALAARVVALEKRSRRRR